jgi:hypothetical protein
MPKMTDDQKKALKDLETLRAEEEKELELAEKEKETAEKEKRAAIASGDKKEEKKAEHIAIASESSINNLSEKIERLDAMIIALAEAKGPDARKAVEETRMKFLRRT